MLNWVICLGAMLFVTMLFSGAVQADSSPAIDPVESRKLRLSDDDMKWWHDAKFGLFMHWGLYAIPAKGEWVQHNDKIPNEEYAKLADQFNPKHFDADAWAKTAKDAGMKYVVLTARHHDGFCLFDSPSSFGQFTSVKTAAKRDFLTDYVKGLRTAGLRVGFYYSPMDWRFPGYFAPKEKLDNALEMKKQCWGQVKELMSNYGPIDVLWYDGGWLAMKGNDADAAWLWESVKLTQMVRGLQPKVVISPRSGWEGDFQVNEGDAPIKGPIREEAWEKCCNLNRGAWGFHKNDHLMSRDEVIHMLVNSVIRGGNLLLNVGPDADGVIKATHVARLREVGDWLAVNGRAIYGTRAGPLQPVDGQCGTTQADGKIYLHILQVPDNKQVTTKLFATPIKSATLLDGTPIPFTETQEGVTFTLPPLPESPDTIIEIK